MCIKLTIIVPTIGRISLIHTLRSIKKGYEKGVDQVIVVSDGPTMAEKFALASKVEHEFLDLPSRANDWGHTPRNVAMQRATGDYILSIDDDDIYIDGAIQFIKQTLAYQTSPHPHIFQMIYRDGKRLWNKKELTEGNVGTPMIVTPNNPACLGRWGNRYAGDYDFILSTSRLYKDLTWVDQPIALIRPDL